MLHAAATYKTELLGYGLPADFLDQLQASLSTFEGSFLNREQNRNQRRGATDGLVVAEKEGRNVLKVLDASVRRALTGDGSLLANWDAARAIRQRPAPAATTPSTPTTPTIAANPAVPNTVAVTTPAAPVATAA
jgi:hypothetical protein